MTSHPMDHPTFSPHPDPYPHWYGTEDIRETGFWVVPHVDDPSFIVAVRPRGDA